MTRLTAAMLAAWLALPALTTAARAQAPAAAPFPVVPITVERAPRHTWAYVAMGAGAALIGGSFALSQRGDAAYGDYLASTDPDRIESLYDRTLRFDRLAEASLLGGEALVATGLYLRFIRRPAHAGLGLVLHPGRCGLSYRF